MSTITTPSQPATSSPLRRLIKRHPLVAYFVIAFAGAWITLLPLLLARNGFGLLPLTLPGWTVYDLIPGLGLFTTIGAFIGPTLAAFIVTAATSGAAGLRQLLRRIGQWRVGAGWYLLALLGYPLLYVGIGIITLGRTSLPTLLAQWSLLFTIYLPYTVWDLISTMGEEMGWVGYALPNLQQRMAPWLSAVTLGVLWALWHLPAFFVTGLLAPFSLVGFAFVIVFAAGVRISWTWIFNKTKGSVLIIALLHAASNGTTIALASRLPMIPPAAILLFLGLLVVVFPVLIIIFTRGRLSYKPDRVVQSAEALPSAETPAANM
jgi:membrane protease YdiL (CAAX protease family)